MQVSSLKNLTDPQRTGCATCKDRKISCDRSLPHCRNCARFGRDCRKYKLRLSWPRDDDCRRAIVAFSVPESKNFGIPIRFWYIVLPVNVIFNVLNSDCKTVQGSTDFSYPFSPYPLESSLNRPTLQDGQSELLTYFNLVASASLPIYGGNIVSFREMIVRLALKDDSATSQAVLRSVLAFSSLHRHGNQQQAQLYKTSALTALRSSSHHEFEMAQGLQHITASMLLLSFETHMASGTSGQWLWYLHGAKDVLMNTLHPVKQTFIDEQLLLYQWTYYTFVLAKFALRHWRNADKVQQKLNRPMGEAVGEGECQRAFRQAERAHLHVDKEGILLRLGHFLMDVAQPGTSRYHSSEYKSWLENIQQDLSHSVGDLTEDISSSSEAPLRCEEKMNSELFALSILIYVERASKQFSGNSPTIDLWTTRALSILSRLSMCNRPFPIFILGCEARTDPQRRQILSIIERTCKEGVCRRLVCIKELVERIWVQDDLHCEGVLDYGRKIDSVVSLCEVLPVFA